MLNVHTLQRELIQLIGNQNYLNVLNEINAYSLSPMVRKQQEDLEEWQCALFGKIKDFFLHSYEVFEDDVEDWSDGRSSSTWKLFIEYYFHKDPKQRDYIRQRDIIGYLRENLPSKWFPKFQESLTSPLIFKRISITDGWREEFLSNEYGINVSIIGTSGEEIRQGFLSWDKLINSF